MQIMKKLKKTALSALLAAGLLLSVLPFPAGAEETAGKTVRVGYVNAITYEEEYEGGYKTGAGYEYLQKISYVTGWNYEYVYGSFKECYDMLVAGEIDLFGDLTYTPERAELFDFSMYPQGSEVYCMYTNEAHEELAIGDVQGFNGCRIGVTANSYQQVLLEEWLAENDIVAEIVPFPGYSALMEALDGGIVETIVTPDLSIAYGYVPLVDVGSSEYYFGVAKGREDLLVELNRAQRELQRNEFDYNGALSRKYHSPTNSAIKLSDAEKKWLAEHDNVLRLGLQDDNLPYSDGAADGSVSGILRVLIDTLEEELGVTVEATCYSGREALLNALETGEVDAIGPVYGDLYLAEQYGWVLTNEMVTTTPVVLYKSAESDGDATIAVSDETLITEDVIHFLFPGVQTYVCDTMEDCLRAVASGKANGTVVTSVRLNTLRQYPAMEKLQFADIPMEAEVCLAATRDNRMAAWVLNKGIALSTAGLNGSVMAQSSYVTPEVTVRDFVRQHMALVLLVGGAVIVALSVMAALLYRNGKRLKVALEQAREANAAKTTFLSNMSHDIRTPMNAIVGLTHLALEEEDLGTIRSYLDKIDASSDFLLGLINDVLDMSKIESGSLTLSPEPLTRVEFAESIDTVIRPLMDSRRLNFECRLEDGPDCILVDRLRFNQIFLNLLSNAAKYTPTGGKVSLIMEELPARAGESRLRFTVRDTGVGMSEGFLDHLYDPFSQEHSQLSGNIKGTGLGLPIVKSLVDAMGGTIAVESHLGQGTTFTVELTVPLAEPVAEADPQQRPAGSELAGSRILLVEDNEINTYVAKLILEEVGCVVTTAENGQDALEQFEASAPGGFDAILMDVRMPVMNGIEATQAIRALSRPDAAAVPIIAMTADAFAEEQKRTLDAGMNAHLAKPIDPPLLYAVLESQIQARPDRPAQH